MKSTFTASASLGRTTLTQTYVHSFPGQFLEQVKPTVTIDWQLSTIDRYPELTSH
ncbi:hypothetical protein ACFQUU_00630 [Herbaspirillum sp. GCM10030257]|uniref:hypothetical protein n=1 Tax=Herbaspirillum sp. GCM10030257 TaxID=3273393 RepID=UPI00361EE0A5